MFPNFSTQREKEKYFRSLSEEQKIDALNQMILESESIVFLGGAGVSHGNAALGRSAVPHDLILFKV